MPEEIAQALSDAQASPEEVIIVPYELYQSFMGRYYIGHTPGLTMKNGSNCWGGIINPRDSDADVFIDSICISNTSCLTVCSRTWINHTPAGSIFASKFVMPANTATNPVRHPAGRLSYAQNIRATPTDGQSLSSLFTRPFGTQTLEYGGKIIIPPGGSCIVFCYAHDLAGVTGSGAGAFTQSCEISMQWWEQPLTE